MRLTYNEVGSVNIHLPASAANDSATEGLCGNFDSIRGNDYNSEKLTDLETIDSCAIFPDELEEHPCDIIPAETMKEIDDMCKELKYVFSDCLGVVSYDKYYDICTYDICACMMTAPEEELCQPCDTFHEFAHHCALEGVVIDWRTSDFCRKSSSFSAMIIRFDLI